MPAIKALAIAEVFLINDVAELAASNGSSCCADQASEQGASQATNSNADGTSDCPECRADLGA